MQGLFGDLGVDVSTRTGRNTPAARTVEYNSRVDRASSDFDQRHNLVFYSTWDLPSPARQGWKRVVLDGWRFAQIAGFRSGFPFTVLAGNCLGDNCTPAANALQLVGNRPNLIPGKSGRADLPARGGRILLDATAFVNPPPGVLGSVGRNAFAGPGFWNVDLSLAKSFRPRSWARIAQPAAPRRSFQCVESCQSGGARIEPGGRPQFRLRAVFPPGNGDGLSGAGAARRIAAKNSIAIKLVF